MANEAAFADHRRTILWNPAKIPNSLEERLARGVALYDRHVVDFIGHDKPWSLLGSVAIQCFKLEEPCVYFIGSVSGAVKIGHSIAPLERLATFQMGSPEPLYILALTTGGMPAEKEYHQRFASHRSHGEWFFRVDEIAAEMRQLNPFYTLRCDWTDDDI